MPGHRGELPAAGHDLIEDHHADGEAGLQGLLLGHVAEVVVGHLVGEDAGELLVIGLAQEPGGDDVLPAARAARVDAVVFHDADLDLVEGPLVVGGLDERAPSPA